MKMIVNSFPFSTCASLFISRSVPLRQRTEERRVLDDFRVADFGVGEGLGFVFVLVKSGLLDCALLRFEMLSR